MRRRFGKNSSQAGSACVEATLIMCVVCLGLLCSLCTLRDSVGNSIEVAAYYAGGGTRELTRFNGGGGVGTLP